MEFHLVLMDAFKDECQENKESAAATGFFRRIPQTSDARTT